MGEGRRGREKEIHLLVFHPTEFRFRTQKGKEKRAKKLLSRFFLNNFISAHCIAELLARKVKVC
jgi:hypothetical protein